ncbi:MAG: hypothetical protein D6692_03840 [Planctomycetota bacterium]|nr:MAG: hypothetical protein D6692_03840 [Planctomycetota bacterium]
MDSCRASAGDGSDAGAVSGLVSGLVSGVDAGLVSGLVSGVLSGWASALGDRPVLRVLRTGLVMAAMGALLPGSDVCGTRHRDASPPGGAPMHICARFRGLACA